MVKNNGNVGRKKLREKFLYFSIMFAPYRSSLQLFFCEQRMKSSFESLIKSSWFCDRISSDLLTSHNLTAPAIVLVFE